MKAVAFACGAVLLCGLLRAQSAPAPSEPETPQVASDYTVGIEDVLQISVWGEPQLNIRVRVRPDGKITCPLVNDVPVFGLTPDQIRKAVTARLANYIKDPNITISVEEINSFRVFVLGEVNKQGPVNFYRPTRLLQALAAAGGFTQFAKKELTLIRERGDTETRTRFNYKRILAAAPGQENVYLKPGDTLVVE